MAKLFDSQHQNAIFKACIVKQEHKSYELTRLLTAHGANPNHIDTLKQTPLYYASREGHYTTVKFLVENGC